jgi:hypothetical protein
MDGEKTRDLAARLKSLADEIAAAIQPDMQSAVTGGQVSGSPTSAAAQAAPGCSGGFFCGKYNCTPPFSCSEFGCTSTFKFGTISPT